MAMDSTTHSHPFSPSQQADTEVKEPKDATDVVASASCSSPEMKSLNPLLKALVECVRLAESEADTTVKLLISVRESVSEYGESTERLPFYFTEALYSKIYVQADKAPTIFDTTSKKFTLSYKPKIYPETGPECRVFESGYNTFRRLHRVHHAVVDGTSFWNFFNTFAEICKGAKKIPKSPDFSRKRVFNSPVVLPLPVGVLAMIFSGDELLRERIFHFSKETILKLKFRTNNPLLKIESD
ncbi:hypothetical protein LguiA_020129 [Lonicera macranthoides]